MPRTSDADVLLLVAVFVSPVVGFCIVAMCRCCGCTTKDIWNTCRSTGHAVSDFVSAIRGSLVTVDLRALASTPARRPSLTMLSAGGTRGKVLCELFTSYRADQEAERRARAKLVEDAAANILAAERGAAEAAESEPKVAWGQTVEEDDDRGTRPTTPMTRPRRSSLQRVANIVASARVAAARRKRATSSENGIAPAAAIEPKVLRKKRSLPEADRFGASSSDGEVMSSHRGSAVRATASWSPIRSNTSSSSNLDVATSSTPLPVLMHSVNACAKNSAAKVW
eukprot:TRINITY_DN43835_c0_g1_i1.p1 TRINITY_DN43835_c0_g1~~TRINITY_DN43835_c0_g1_i1.p1  ORF type:complete len:282 (+),score=33.48 TRINITY_DN43835_c0_g1_i1:167-1012(+)